MAGALAVGTAECVAEAPDGPAVAGDAQPATIQTTARSVSTRTSPIRRSAAAVRGVGSAAVCYPWRLQLDDPARRVVHLGVGGRARVARVWWRRLSATDLRGRGAGERYPVPHQMRLAGGGEPARLRKLPGR